MTLNAYSVAPAALKKALGGKDPKLAARAIKNSAALPSDRAAAKASVEAWITTGKPGDVAGYVAAVALEAIIGEVGDALDVAEITRDDFNQIDARLKRVKHKGSVFALFAPAKWPKLPPIEDLPIVANLDGKSLDAIAESLRKDRAVKPKPFRGHAPDVVYEIVHPKTGATFSAIDSGDFRKPSVTMTLREKGKPPKKMHGWSREMGDAISSRFSKGWIWANPENNEPAGKDPLADRFDAFAAAVKRAAGEVWLFLW